MFVIVLFHLCPHESYRSRILIPFSKNVALSRIVHFLFATTFDSCLSISIALCCAFAITYTFVVCYTSTCIFVDVCTSTSTMFSSLASFCITYASTKCSSTTLSSLDSSMNIKSTNVTIGPFDSFAC